MKTLNITLEDNEFEQLKAFKDKYDLTWYGLLVQILEWDLEGRFE